MCHSNKKHFILKLFSIFQNEMQFHKNPKVRILHLHLKITKKFQEHIMQIIFILFSLFHSWTFNIVIGHPKRSLKQTLIVK